MNAKPDLNKRVYLEIDVFENVDIWRLREYINTFQGINCNVVTLSTIRVHFNPSKISEKKVLKLIQAFSGNGRKRNVAHIKEIHPNQAA